MKGSQEYLYSREGVTQVDPISMFMYAIGTFLLIQQLKNPNRRSQVWYMYADDSSTCGKLSLQDWLIMLMEKGPGFGCFPEPSKSWLIINESNTNQAINSGEFGLKIATSGRFLGGIVSDKASIESFVKKKV